MKVVYTTARLRNPNLVFKICFININSFQHSYQHTFLTKKALPHGSTSFNNKPIIITFLTMEKVILLCIIKTFIT